MSGEGKATAAGPATGKQLPQYILDAIYGKQSQEQKQEAYKKSLVNWWQVGASAAAPPTLSRTSTGTSFRSEMIMSLKSGCVARIPHRSTQIVRMTRRTNTSRIPFSTTGATSRGRFPRPR